jgi:hypothetical protein
MCFNCAQGTSTPNERTMKKLDETAAKIAAVGEVLRSLPLLEDQCRRAGLFDTAMYVRSAVKRSGFEAEYLFGKWIKEDDKKKAKK